MAKRENFSKKRQAILEVIQGTTIHPTAEWVYQQLKPKYPDLSLGTVYRNITRFKTEGTIISVGVVDGQERFDGNVNPHSHFICSECGAVLDFTESYVLTSAYEELSRKYKIQVSSHELIFRGICSKCLGKKPQKECGMEK